MQNYMYNEYRVSKKYTFVDHTMKSGTCRHQLTGIMRTSHLNFQNH